MVVMPVRRPRNATGPGTCLRRQISGGLGRVKTREYREGLQFPSAAHRVSRGWWGRRRDRHAKDRTSRSSAGEFLLGRNRGRATVQIRRTFDQLNDLLGHLDELLRERTALLADARLS